MTLEEWEQKVLAEPGAEDRVAAMAIEMGLVEHRGSSSILLSGWHPDSGGLFTREIESIEVSFTCGWSHKFDSLVEATPLVPEHYQRAIDAAKAAVDAMTPEQQEALRAKYRNAVTEAQRIDLGLKDPLDY